MPCRTLILGLTCKALTIYLDTDIKSTRLKNAAISWDENDRPRSLDFDDIYFSRGDPVAESHHVFIKGNALETRMTTLVANPLVIAEYGFGFGLNFLVTCEYFCRLAPRQAHLHYLSCEIHPVVRQDLMRFYRQLPASIQGLADTLLANYPEQGQGIHRLQFQFLEREITLDLLYGHASNAFNTLCLPAQFVDAWYLDGHAPARNEEMWALSLCTTMAKLSKPGSTTFSTYSVAGSVRRNLAQAGFNVKKMPGFGNKRQMLGGEMAQHEPHLEAKFTHWSNPWPSPQHGSQDITTVAVIGAGLAGSATAHALAKRGYQVTLIEKNEGLATGASGNPQGIVHFNPGRELTDACRFRLSAFNYASRHYQTLKHKFDFSWQPSGLIQLANTDQELKAQQELISLKLYSPELMQTVSAQQASEIANIKLTCGGLYFPGASSLSPVALCQAWLSHKNIQLLTSHQVLDFCYQDGQWQVCLSSFDQQTSQSFDALVICNNNQAVQFSETAAYPYICNHGQTDSFPYAGSMLTEGSLQTMLRHQGYIIPWKHSGKPQLTVGGSFAQGEQQARESELLRNKNIHLMQTFPSSIVDAFHTAATSQTEPVRSRSGTRCTTPDYLPLAGRVEKQNETTSIFSNYQRNAKKEIIANADYHPDLYINVAHGSSGLITTPLLAETIASLIDRDSLPISEAEYEAVVPLRYLIRNLKRQKA